MNPSNGCHPSKRTRPDAAPAHRGRRFARYAEGITPADAREYLTRMHRAYLGIVDPRVRTVLAQLGARNGSR